MNTQDRNGRRIVFVIHWHGSDDRARSEDIFVLLYE